MRFVGLTVGVAALAALAACGGSDRQAVDERAAAYGYTDEMVTVAASTPPTQPADPTVPGQSGASAVTQHPTVQDVCVVDVGEGENLGVVTSRLVGIDQAALRRENGLGEDGNVAVGDRLDVCVGNGLNDLDGTSRVAPSALYARVVQLAMNRLFAGTSMHQLAVDGQAGKLTQQMVCAARAMNGFPVSMGFLVPDSAEADALLSTPQLAVPDGAPTAERWILIDKTCQVMFAGEGPNTLIDVYPTSTGSPGYETTDGTGFEAFRFNPALENNGWHDSTAYPADIDAPNSGNMYKPIYFNGGEAIHGAAYIPAEPRSKGCARTFPEHQDRIVEWLGLEDLPEGSWKPDEINLTVEVRGDYRTPEGERLPEPDVIIPPLYDQQPNAATASEQTDGAPPTTATG